MISNLREINVAKEKFTYHFLNDLIDNADDELLELEQKYNIVRDLARDSLIRIATTPDQFLEDNKELSDTEIEKLIEEIKIELYSKIDNYI